MKIYYKLIFIFEVIKFLPLIILVKCSSKRKKIIYHERETWYKIILNRENLGRWDYVDLCRLPEYRSLLYYRLGDYSKLIRWILPGEKTLHFNTNRNNIGEGLVIQHGFSTIINAISIGKDCQIWQNVTIGVHQSHWPDNLSKPIIGDNVKVCAHSVIIGAIRIGNNVTIGAGSIVVKSVPDNAVIVGNPAHIVKLNGKKVNIKL